MCWSMRSRWWRNARPRSRLSGWGPVGLNGLRRVIMRAPRTGILLSFVCLAALVGSAGAQDSMPYLAFSSPEMTQAEMTRADVKAGVATASNEPPADLTSRRLSGLD